jgi:signal transduction histidine kinase
MPRTRRAARKISGESSKVAFTDQHQDHPAVAPHAHVVQFYRHDSELSAGVIPYLAEAIAAGGVAIVIATEAHRQAFADGMGLTGEAAARLILLDAAEAMDTLLVDGRLAAHRFDKLIGELVRDIATGGGPIHAFGEIVALMWAEGHVAAALELEDLWNGLAREVDFGLYCAYPVASMSEGDADAFPAVCAQHSAVVGAPSVVARAFPWSGVGPADARRFVTESLVAWSRTDLIDDAAVIITELATNALLHARTGFTVTVSCRVDGTIRLSVRDASAVPPRLRRPAPFEGSGRGLALVAAIATGWGADVLTDGKVVWAQLPSAQLPSAPLTLS